MLALRVQCLIRAIACAFLSLLLLATATKGSPTIALPVSAQLPPVAQVNEEFAFTFSNSTFASSIGGLTYNITDAPSWLSFDASARHLSGTPGLSDEGAASFRLEASDISGTAVLPVTLVVVQNAGPAVNPNAEQQLATYQNFAAPDTIVARPGDPINVQFSQQTFLDTDRNTSFIAIGTDRTPLPSWLQFNPSTLTFSGIAPVELSPTELPQSFDLNLLASDVTGYSQAEFTFRLTIDDHRLLFGQSVYDIRAIPGQMLSYGKLGDKMTLDGKPINASNVSLEISDQPDWVNIDANLTISGQVPVDVGLTNFTVTIWDHLGDVATTNVVISIPELPNPKSLILGYIQAITVDIGTPCDYTLARSNFAPGNLSITLDLGNASSWLHFNNSSLTLTGVSPKDLEPQEVCLTLKVSQGTNVQVQNITLNVRAGIPTNETSSSIILSSPTSSTIQSSFVPTVTSTSTPQHGSSPVPASRKVVPAVLCSVLGTAVLVMALCLRRRKRLTALKPSQARSRTDSMTSVVAEPFWHPCGLRQLLPRVERHSRILPAAAGNNGLVGGIHGYDNVTPQGSISRLTPTRPKRPRSGAPQVSRFVLERDPSPDPILELRDSPHFFKHSSVLSKKRRSVSEPLQISNCIRRDFTSSATASRRSVGTVKHPGSFSFQSTGLGTDGKKTVGQDERLPIRSFSSGYPVSSEGSGSFVCAGSRLDVSKKRTPRHQHESSAEWTTTEESFYSFDRPIHEHAAPADQQSQTLLNSKNNSDLENTNRFRGSTVRPVTPSTPSTPSIPRRSSKRGKKPLRVSSSIRGSYSSNSPRRSMRLSMSSPTRSMPNHKLDPLAAFIKGRRQQPASMHFSNTVSSRPASHSLEPPSLRHMNIDDITVFGEPDTDETSLYHPEADFLGRKRSRGAVEKLGRQIHGGSVPLARSSSNKSKSSITGSELSIRKIERQLEEPHEKAEMRKQLGTLKRNSRQRLSAVIESQALNGQGPSVRLGENKAARIGAQENAPQSVSFKGQVKDSLADDRSNTSNEAEQKDDDFWNGSFKCFP